ncbi:MAG: type I asparaginase [Bacteroidales bacterium]|jgi:L-asparaginase|nr:type I asparaginase [Bacteroidales bacterium]
MQKILIIYTGGTIGMIKQNGVLVPFNIENLLSKIPLLSEFPAEIFTVSLDKPIDSSNANIDFWIKIVDIISINYENYDGFIILHGSDTMAYTASALSFMFANLTKPVILTGSQLPIGLIRTDGRENLIASLELACKTKNDEKALIQEVCIYFESKLFRGNRTTKYSAEKFDAFFSPNFPLLAKVGTKIDIKVENLLYPEKENIKIHKNFSSDIVILKLFPGISRNTVKAITEIPELKGIILETFGAGNAPEDILDFLKIAIDNGIIIFNVTQCMNGKVENIYAVGENLANIGVVSGKDITTEAALTKMMYLFGNNFSNNEIKKLLQQSLRGEIS